jgi:hypothetical protein
MVTRFQAKTYGADIVSRKLRNLAKRGEDMRPAWPGVAVRAAAGYRRSFDRSGPGWQPLKPSTQRRRIADGLPPGPPLVATGAYRDEASNPLNFELLMRRDALAIIIPGDKAAYHQGGTKRFKPRPLKLSWGDQMVMLKHMEKILHEGYSL